MSKRKNTQVSPTERDNEVLHIEGDTHRKYLKIAKLNGQFIECYVDLRSSVMALREDLAKDRGFTYHETIVKDFIGYGGGRVDIDGIEIRFEIHIVSAASQVVPLLVGHPYMEHPKVVIVSRPGEHLVTDKTDNPFDIVHHHHKTAFKARITFIIPNNYRGHISLAGNSPTKELCIEGGLRDKRLSVSRCIVQTNEQGETSLPVLNMTGGPLIVKPGDVISRGEECEEFVQDQREVNTEAASSKEINTELKGEGFEKLVNVVNDNRDLITRHLYQLRKNDSAKR